MSVAATYRKPAPARGFTLLEIFIAVAVLGILTILATPSMVEVGRRMTVTEHTNDLVGALTTAKSEAAKLGALSGVVGAGNNWSSGGWQVLVDSNNDNTLTSADTVIATYAALTNQYTVKTKVTGGSDAQVAFNPQGALAAPATQADINVCRPDNQPTQSVWIHVAASGLITSRRDTSLSPAPGC
jgi:prepilin-type N-terminal cleavage/methylation domain-containing protein